MGENKKFLKIVITVLLVGLLGVFLFAVNQEYLSNETVLGEDVFKLTYQFLIIGILGGGVAVLYQKLQTDHENHKAELIRKRDIGIQRAKEWSLLSVTGHLRAVSTIA